AAAMAGTHFGFGAQSALVVPPVVIVAPVTLPPMAMALQSAWTLTAGAGGFASGDFPGGNKYTNAAQSPVTATTNPPPSHPRTCWLLLSRRKPHKPSVPLRSLWAAWVFVGNSDVSPPVRSTPSSLSPRISLFISS